MQDPKNKRNIICDESLRAIFRVNSINMFQMNKALTKHIWPLSAEDGIFFGCIFYLSAMDAPFSLVFAHVTYILSSMRVISFFICIKGTRPTMSTLIIAID